MVKMIRTRLAAMSFLEFAVWGSYLISLGNFLSGIGLAKDIYWFYTVQGIVSILMPALVGIVADKWVQAQKMLSLCHLIAGLSMGAAGWYCLSHGENVEFGPLFVLYTVSVAFYMPTIGLSNAVAYSALSKAGLDTIKAFPPIRVLGTVGFIVAELMVNFIHIEGVSMQYTCYQLFLSGAFSLVMVGYALTMPACPVNKSKTAGGLAEALGIKAFSLFKEKRMAIFFIFSFMLGVSLQITNSYGTPFISSFSQVVEYANSWVAKNSTALISLSQMSETLCILLIPFCLKKFGIKAVMLMSMFAWVLRFGFFGLGNPEGGVALFVASMIVYGVAFDFFNVSGSLYVDTQTDASMRSSAQGLFMLMTNGLGATAGTLVAGAIVNHFVYSHEDPMAQIEGWKISWYCFAGFALIVAIAFWLIFKDDTKTKDKEKDIFQDSDPGGMVVENGNV
ncbi:MAG: MFS transporter [Muribaculaceae bacterium]|nr:MFS transporter [Muribaculaceae bacterium]